MRLMYRSQTFLSKPRGKVKSVNFPNDLDSLRDPLIRVLYEMDIELWELRGAWVLLGAMNNHRVSGSTFP